MAFSQGGTHFASCSQEGSLAVFSMETMEQMVLLQAPKKVDVWNGLVRLRFILSLSLQPVYITVLWVNLCILLTGRSCSEWFDLYLHTI